MRSTAGRILAATAVTALVVLAGCQQSELAEMRARKETAAAGTAEGAPAGAPAAVFRDVTRAVARLMPTAGHDVRGTVTFIDTEDGGMRVVADVTGLEPGSRHGFHVHEFGDVTAPDGTAAGGHYDPEGHDHALPGTTPRHAGDLGNLEADERGHAHFELVVENATVAGPANPVIGRAVIVHARPDDGGQPTGNAGPRLAQGVIGIDEATEPDSPREPSPGS